MSSAALAFVTHAFPSTRNFTHQNVSSTSTIRPVCSVSPLSRRNALKLFSIGLATGLLPTPALSESMNERSVRRKVGKVSLSVNKAKALLSTATEWKDTISEDDQLYILRFIPIWLEPARIAIADIASQQGVNIGDKGNVQSKSAALYGHLLELRGEAKARKKGGVVRELDEFVETALEFLALPDISKFTA